MKKTTQFKNLLLEGKILLMPVVHDPLCAKIAQDVGFKAMCTAGYANSAAQLGKPDISLLTQTEMADCASRIVDATDLPVFADGDTGHGGIPNVIRTVQLFEKAGVASLFIEDQAFPKRCGHMDGKHVIPAKEMVVKIKAALDARKDDDFMIMARTDAIAVNGIEDALDRAHKYTEAGADIIFIEAPENLEQLKRIPKELSVPTMANMIPGGKTPIMPAKDLEEMGYAFVVYPTACTYTIAKATQEYFKYLFKNTSTLGFDDKMLEFTEFNRLVGLDEIRASEKKYLAQE
jgi:2,3-dimethylmalate lyase